MGLDGRPNLEQLAIKYGTLKVPHGYMPIYERFFSPFRDSPIHLLEIGVHEGDSLRMWAEYFLKGRIVGADKVITTKAREISEKYELIQCDVLYDCAKIPWQFDIIIDDGSHIANEQLVAFRDLWGQVKPGGYYIVEDLFTLYDNEWNPEPQHTIVKEVVSRMRRILVGGDTIQEVYFFGRFNINGMMFLRKRYEEYRIQPLSEFEPA